MTQAQAVVYTAMVCPYAQRALLALEEAGVPHERYEVDLLNKPSWYNDKVNPASKVPVLKLNPSDKAENGGGSDANGTVTIPESLVIAQYVAEEHGEAGLLPASAVERAKVRYVIERFSQLLPMSKRLVTSPEKEALPLAYEALDFFQASLDKAGPFALGAKYSLLDIAVAPFIGRLLLQSKHGFLEAVGGSDLHKVVTDPNGKYARLAQWWQAVSSRPSWKSTFDEPEIVRETQRRIDKAAKEEQSLKAKQ